eukprot:Hpha_TRINITY_DN6643_c0_g1::TRINITY_DN6643_c0_g1_i2::g.26544::m.26544
MVRVEEESSEPVDIKMDFGGDVRRFRASKFSEFEHQVVELFRLQGPLAERWTFQYFDDDDEWITFETNLELQEAKRHARLPKGQGSSEFAVPDRRAFIPVRAVSKQPQSASALVAPTPAGEAQSKSKRKKEKGPREEKPRNGVSCRFVSNENYQGSSVFLRPGTSILKKWRVRNDGSEPWPKEVGLQKIGGDGLEGDSYRPVDGGLPVGEDMVVEFPMTMPSRIGQYEYYFKMREGADGRKFGQRLWFIVVISDKPDAPETDDS